jgi:hypothetical protein
MLRRKLPEMFRFAQHDRLCMPGGLRTELKIVLFIRVIRTAIGQNRRALRRFFCPRITLIYANRKRVSHVVRSREDFRSWECRAALAPLFGSVRFDPKRLAAACRTPKASPNRTNFFPIGVHSRVSRAKFRLRRSRAGSSSFDWLAAICSTTFSSPRPVLQAFFTHLGTI